MKKITAANALLTQTKTSPATATEVGFNFNFNQKEKTMSYLNTNLKNMKMENGRAIRLLALSIALFVGLLGFAPSATFAQEMSDNPTQVELEQFRADYAKTIADLNAHAAVLQHNPLVRESLTRAANPEFRTSAEDRNAEAQRQIQKMSYEELTRVYKALNKHFPKWRESPQTLAATMEKLNSRSKNGGGAGTGIEVGTTSNAATPDDCAFAFSQQPSWTDWAAAQGLADGSSAGLPFTAPLYIPLAATAVGLEAVNLIYERCQGDQDIAELKTSINKVQNSVDDLQNSQTDIINSVNAGTTSVTNAITNAKTDIVNNDNSNKTAIVNNDNSNKDTIVTSLNAKTTQIINNDNSNKDTIVINDNSNRTQIINNDNTNATNILNNDNANKTAIINNANANTTTLNTAITNAKNEVIANANANKDFALRQLIEANLSAPPETVAIVGLYAAPASKGGYLELTRSILAQHLATFASSPYSDRYKAESLMAMGDAVRNTNDFLGAYTFYRRAYRAASGAGLPVK